MSDHADSIDQLDTADKDDTMAYAEENYDRHGGRLIDSAVYPLREYTAPELLEMIVDASIQRSELIADAREHQAERVEAFILRLRAELLGRVGPVAAVDEGGV